MEIKTLASCIPQVQKRTTANPSSAAKSLTTAARPNFEYVPQDTDAVKTALTAHYEHFVVQRGGEYVAMPELEYIAADIAAWLCGSKRGLLLVGACGTGKSIFLKSIMELLKTYYGKPLKQTYSGLRKQVLFNAIELSRQAADDPETFDAICRYYPVVAVDDVGVEPAVVKHYGTEATPLSEFIYARYDRMLPTILATNLTMDEIEARYGSRVADRLYEMYDRMVFDFPSFRKR